MYKICHRYCAHTVSKPPLSDAQNNIFRITLSEGGQLQTDIINARGQKSSDLVVKVSLLLTK